MRERGDDTHKAGGGGEDITIFEKQSISNAKQQIGKIGGKENRGVLVSLRK